jgi:glycosyltransferase involved in cell wall biosynthesis
MPKNDAEVDIHCADHEETPVPRNRCARVLIIQEQMKEYRVPFFIRLSDALQQDGILLRVAYSEPKGWDGRNDSCDLPSNIGRKVRGRWMLGGRVLYQPLLREILRADLVIAQEANKHLLNYLLVLVSTLGFKRISFWGFGANRNENRLVFSEWIRKKIVSKVDWYFAYTRSAVECLVAKGVRRERITVVENAVDTQEFSDLVGAIDDSEICLKKKQFGIEEASCIGLYCGVLSPDKGIDFLLRAAVLVRQQLPSFHLLVAGGGPEHEKVSLAASTHPWIHYLGPTFGRDKAMLFKMAGVVLLPGRVGLAILDAFAAGLPLLTIQVSYHGPEIEYLEDGRNGLMVKNDVSLYASRVVSVLSDASLREKFQRAASDSGRRYSIDAMVSNFRNGIRACLGWSEQHFSSVPDAAS